jgi:hypothetical protein
MGLDWNPGNKAKPGLEAEHEKLVRSIKSGSVADQEAALARFSEISINAYETLQAPRVGYDAEATQWAKEIYAQQQPELPEAEWLEQYKGYYALELLPPCDGLPRYTNAPITDVEEFSFRAQFLQDCVDIIGEDLLKSSYELKLPAELMAYGKQLITRAEQHAAQHGLDLAQLDEDTAKGIERQLHIVLSAGRWCVFWAERGHMLDPYY